MTTSSLDPLDPYLDTVTGPGVDARDLPLPTSSVEGVAVTSPPYWRLRNYGDDARELGRRTLDEYLTETLDALDELGRVLVDDALVWWNVGDTRTGSGGAGGDYRTGGKRSKQRPTRRGTAAQESHLPRGQWALVPHRFAIGAQSRGWLVLAAVTWSKGKVRLRNGVPELLTRRRPEDLRHVRRPGISSEMIFLFARTLDARRRFRPSLLEETGDVWTFPPDAVKGRKHDAPYPPELVRRCILPTTLPGDIVLDPFAGSGTTLHIATAHGRRAIGFDLYAGDGHPVLSPAETRP
jgi:site-specific DNA-methyltransferase (cytosine-N4-specific)